MAYTPGPWTLHYGDFPSLMVKSPSGNICEVMYQGHLITDDNGCVLAAAPGLLAACEKLVETAYFQPEHPKQWACRICHHWHWKQKDIIHSDWCAVPQAEAAIAKAGTKHPTLFPGTEVEAG